MADFVILEAAEDGEILEDLTDDVTEGSIVEDILFQVPLSLSRGQLRHGLVSGTGELN